MTNRIASFATGLTFAALASTASFSQDGVANAASTVDGPRVAIGTTPADAAASQSAGTVGAMHYAVAGVATSSGDVQRQGGGTTAASVRWIRTPVQQPGS